MIHVIILTTAVFSVGFSIVYTLKNMKPKKREYIFIGDIKDIFK